MTDAQPARVRRHFARASDDWGRRYQSKPRGMADLDLLLRRACFQKLLHERIDAAGRLLQVVDIGCGSGHVLDGIDRESIRVIGVDFVPQMLAAAAGEHPQDRFLAADATLLPIADASADVITCSGVLEYLTNPEAAVAAMADVLRPNGTLIASFPNRQSVFRRLVAAERGCEKLAVGMRDSLTGRNGLTTASNAYRQRRWSVAEAKTLVESCRLPVRRTLICTFGPWGRLGRIRLMMRASSKLTGTGRRAGVWQRMAGSTIVIEAHKPPTAGRAGYDSTN